jgi:hypothetical protein
MTFRLSGEARQYFKKIEENSTTGKFETLWDKYYLCLMVGYLNTQLGKETPKSDEFVDSFIHDYSTQRFQIIAMLIISELNRQGIKNMDKKSVKKIMLDLVDHNSNTCLSDEGHKLMNRYAEGGFELIYEEIPQPYDFDLFMKEYYDKFVRLD